MAFSYLSLRVSETRDPITRMWNALLQELQRRTLTGTYPISVQEGISGGVNISMIKLPTGGSTTPLPFTVYATDKTKIKVLGGIIIWNDLDIVVADSAEITVSSTSKVWISLDNEFNPVTPTFNTGASLPSQPNPPARKHLLLATVTLGGSPLAITGIAQVWNGGNIIWPCNTQLRTGSTAQHDLRITARTSTTSVLSDTIEYMFDHDSKRKLSAKIKQ